MVPFHPSLAQLTVIATLCIATPLTRAAETDHLVANWLAAQAKIQTWSAHFKQTRTLKTLTTPLISHGRLWFAAPDRFRWELGSPSQTIAIRRADQLTVIYPKLKRAERFPLSSKKKGDWTDLLALLEAGFPRNRTDLEAKFRILSTTVGDRTAEITLQPISRSARRMIPQIKIGFDPKQLSLRHTELDFADGSRMRNDFSDTQLNPPVDSGLFAPAIGADYTIVEPTK